MSVENGGCNDVLRRVASHKHRNAVEVRSGTHDIDRYLRHAGVN